MFTSLTFIPNKKLEFILNKLAELKIKNKHSGSQAAGLYSFKQFMRNLEIMNKGQRDILISFSAFGT